MNKVWNQIYRDVLSEFYSTFILTVLQTGLATTVIVSGKTEGDAGVAALATGLTVMVAVYTGGGASGAHINPAVTSTFAIMGKTAWIRVPFYLIAQYFGAFMGAAATHCIYLGAINSYTGNPVDLRAIWTTFPAKFLSPGNAMLDSIFSSTMLMLLILAVNDQKNMKLTPGMAPLFYGLIVTAVSFGFSFNCGNPMNPARDLGPRIWAYVSGHGPDVMNGPNYVWWWIPVIFPHVGTLIGAIIYESLVEFQHPEEQEVIISRPSSTTMELSIQKSQVPSPPEVELLLTPCPALQVAELHPPHLSEKLSIQEN